jgi:hypothetical protein
VALKACGDPYMIIRVLENPKKKKRKEKDKDSGQCDVLVGTSYSNSEMMY